VSCWRVSFDALDPCGADEGPSSSNRKLMLGRTASAVGGRNRTKAASAEGAGSCRRVSRRVRDLHGERRAQTRRII
jgi:hypothetical protein